MSVNGKTEVKAAILDLNNGHPNQGMRCIRQILKEYGIRKNVILNWDEFDVRQNNAVPGLEYDVYISSGGPGNPFDGVGTIWEDNFFNWIGTVDGWNKNQDNFPKKHIFFICHSFQLACRYFNTGNVCKRRSTAFGVFPIHLFSSGQQEAVFAGMADPFFAVDSRDYQVIQPNYQLMHNAGATVLAIEKERPHVNLERAIMAVRFNDYMVGTQFHPEADAQGMSLYLQQEDKRDTVIENHGLEKWRSMMEQLNDPDKIMLTYSKVLPNFLDIALKHLTVH
ncbi:MAG TPA: GMP synthase [Ferruginibacter sp.]|nr:GMP synthase [Ferruginibacter sp.]HMP21035.1 GMP synthase [Ferruginibacter sp.]